MKLSPAQRKLLAELANEPQYVAPYYAPFLTLQHLGLVENREGRTSSTAYITDAGRKALVES